MVRPNRATPRLTILPIAADANLVPTQRHLRLKRCVRDQWLHTSYELFQAVCGLMQSEVCTPKISPCDLKQPFRRYLLSIPGEFWCRVRLLPDLNSKGDVYTDYASAKQPISLKGYAIE